MSRGKETCRILKEIRRQIAAANDIDLLVSECQYKGDCLGTCPKCEAEVRYLEQALERRRLAGRAVSLLGISAGLLAASTGVSAAGKGTMAAIQVQQDTTVAQDTARWESEICGGAGFNVARRVVDEENRPLQGVTVKLVRGELSGVEHETDEKGIFVFSGCNEGDSLVLTYPGMETVRPLKRKRSEMRYKGEPVEKPLAYLPVFPGTNCDYDTAKAFRRAGAEVKMSVFRNLTAEDIFSSIAEMKKNISECHILALCGGFSAGDEPDGSGKFIANVLNNKDIADEIHKLLDRGGLILGICNGFQALVKSGLLPYGRLGMVTKDSPVLFRNDINRHISQMVTTRVASVNSPWLAGFSVGDLHTVAVSHGEGKFVVNEDLARELFANGQVAFQYVDPVAEEVTMTSPYNPNGSYYAIEGIVSPDGQILGKMGHTERYEPNLFRNIEEELEQPIFDNAVRYFRGN